MTNSTVIQVEIDAYFSEDDECEHLDEEHLQDEVDAIEADHETTTVICNICSENVDRDALQKHMEDCHFKFQCPQCCKKYFTASLLRRHLRCAHLESMNLKCPFCPTILKTKYNFQQHLFTHSSTGQFTCSFEGCKRNFKHINTLRQHEKIHAKRNRRECPVCHEHFTRLQTHMLTHSKDRPYVCDICDRGYVSKQQLNLHKTSHSEEGHFCEICNVKYKSVGSLYKHQKTVHCSAKYQCPECCRSYNRRDNMMSHFKKVHSGLASGKRDGIIA